MTTAGEMIQQALRVQNVSQTELAARLKIPLSTLNGYIHGKYKPDYNRLTDIAKALGVTRDYLLGEDKVNLLGEDELKIVLKYREFSERQRIMLMEYVKFLESQG